MFELLYGRNGNIAFFELVQRVRGDSVIGDDRVHLVQIRHMREGLNAELAGIGEQNDLIGHAGHLLLNPCLQLVGFTDSPLQMDAFAGKKHFIDMVSIQGTLRQRANEGQRPLEQECPLWR